MSKLAVRAAVAARGEVARQLTALLVVRPSHGATFVQISAHLYRVPLRTLDRELQWLRRAGVVRTIRDRARYGDSCPRWELCHMVPR